MSPTSTLSDADAKMSRLILLDYASGRITREECLGYLYLLKRGGLFLVRIAGQETYLSLEDIEALIKYGVKDDHSVLLDKSYNVTGTEEKSSNEISLKELKLYYDSVEMTDDGGHTFVGTSATRLEQKWLPLLREEERNPGKKEKKEEKKVEKPELKTQEKEEPKTEKEKILECIDRDLEDGLITKEEAESYREKAENGELMLVEMGGTGQDYYLPVDKAQTLLGDSASASLGLQVAQTKDEKVAVAVGLSTAAVGVGVGAGKLLSEKTLGSEVEQDKKEGTEGEGVNLKEQEGKLVTPPVAAQAVDEQAEKDKKEKEEKEKEAKQKKEPLSPTERLPILSQTKPLSEQKTTPKTKSSDIPDSLLARGPTDPNKERVSSENRMISKQSMPKGSAPTPGRRTQRTTQPLTSTLKQGASTTKDEQPQTPNRFRGLEEKQRNQQDQNKEQAKQILEEEEKKQKASRYQKPQPAAQKKNPMSKFVKIGFGGTAAAGAAGVGTALLIQTSDASEHIAMVGHILHSIFISLA